ncbi:MAG: fluoride efflux transporter CrcB [Venatoribacter sp.]
MNLLWIALGGSLGALSRFWLSGTIASLASTHLPERAHFPFGTFSVNVIGSFIIGMLWFWLVQQNLGAQHYRFLLITGFLGAFTTFSSFSLESILLLQQERWLSFALYAGGSLLTCLVATVLGMLVAKQFV